MPRAQCDPLAAVGRTHCAGADRQRTFNTRIVAIVASRIESRCDRSVAIGTSTTSRPTDNAIFRSVRKFRSAYVGWRMARLAFLPPLRSTGRACRESVAFELVDGWRDGFDREQQPLPNRRRGVRGPAIWLARGMSPLAAVRPHGTKAPAPGAACRTSRSTPGFGRVGTPRKTRYPPNGGAAAGGTVYLAEPDEPGPEECWQTKSAISLPASR
jgi:hypothetical protein